MDLTGTLISLLLADPTLVAGGLDGNGHPITPLLPAAAIVMGKEIEDEQPAPPAVLIEDAQTPPQWITTTSRIEKHTVKVVIYAAQGTTANQTNPAKAIADAVEAAWDWKSMTIPDVADVQSVKRTRRDLTESGKRSRDDMPVYVAHVEWEVNIWIGP